MTAAYIWVWLQRNDEAELRQMMAKKFKGLSEAKQARQALEAELADVRGQMAARVAQLEAERDASAAQAQASIYFWNKTHMQASVSTRPWRVYSVQCIVALLI